MYQMSRHKRYAVVYRNSADGINEYKIINTFPTQKEARAFIDYQHRHGNGEWKVKVL